MHTQKCMRKQNTCAHRNACITKIHAHTKMHVQTKIYAHTTTRYVKSSSTKKTHTYHLKGYTGFIQKQDKNTVSMADLKNPLQECCTERKQHAIWLQTL